MGFLRKCQQTNMMLSEAPCEEGESPGQHRPHSSAVEGDDGEYLNIFTEEPRSLVSLTLELAELRSNTNKVRTFDKNF